MRSGVLLAVLSFVTGLLLQLPLLLALTASGVLPHALAHIGMMAILASPLTMLLTGLVGLFIPEDACQEALG